MFTIEAIKQLQKERDRLLQVAKDAVELASICSDWGLNEVEIQGELVGIYDLQRRFIAAVEATKGDWFQKVKDRMKIDEEIRK